MIGLLISLLVLALILGVFWWGVTLFKPPQPILNILQVIIVLIFVIALINVLLGISGGGYWPHYWYLR